MRIKPIIDNFDNCSTEKSKLSNKTIPKKCALIKGIVYNKRGGEKILSIWWFFVLAFVTGVIVIGVFIYFSADINVKGIEADILAKKILGCISENGYLNENVLNNDFDIFSKCGLNKKVFGKGSNFYFKILIYDEKGSLLKEIKEGDYSFEANCKLVPGVKAENFPSCSEKTENVLMKDRRNFKLTVLAASNQIGGSISVIK